VAEEDRMVPNKLEDCGKNKRCDKEHVDELVMIIWILHILPCKVQAPCLWNRMTAIEISGLLNCNDGIYINIKLPIGLLKVTKRCKQCVTDH
jgi:hypothetical protein